jgi:hypothetical protein
VSVGLIENFVELSTARSTFGFTASPLQLTADHSTNAQQDTSRFSQVSRKSTPTVTVVFHPQF